MQWLTVAIRSDLHAGEERNTALRKRVSKTRQTIDSIMIRKGRTTDSRLRHQISQSVGSEKTIANVRMAMQINTNHQRYRGETTGRISAGG